MLFTRRTLFASALALGASLEAPWANAALARGLTLAELVAASAHGIVATALDAHCEWETFGRQRVIVTETRVRIEEAVLGAAPSSRELLVRVLGGSIGELGERVDGQAQLVIGKPSVLFLTATAKAEWFVTGAAQGHYPLAPDDRGDPRLTPSPHLPRLIAPDRAAVSRLRGRTLPEARHLLRNVPR